MKKKKRIKGKKLETVWHLPYFGVVFDTFPGRPPIDNADVGEICLRPAYSADDVGLPTEEVTRVLENKHQCDGVGKSTLWITPQRVEAETLADTWSSNHHKPYRAADRPVMLDTALFMMFASMEPSPEGILQFAREYGNLTEGYCPILVWQEEVVAMRWALRIWECLKANNSANIRKHFRWRPFPKELREYLKNPSHAPLSNEYLYEWLTGTVGKWNYLEFDSHPDLAHGRQAKFPDKRLTETISLRCLSQEEWNRQTESLNPLAVASAYLLQVLNDRTRTYLQPRLDWKDAITLTRSFAPKHLLGRLWLQFEESITGRKEYRVCQGPGCGKSFEVSPAIARSDKLYHSESCRVRAYQARAKQTR
ncbi:MAG: hypothetical protein FJ271_15155 [Planctomycetes bacterium]|nr:hypothetical protein [Planctomycetota bacterium]